MIMQNGDAKLLISCILDFEILITVFVNLSTAKNHRITVLTIFVIKSSLIPIYLTYYHLYRLFCLQSNSLKGIQIAHTIHNLLSTGRNFKQFFRQK